MLSAPQFLSPHLRIPATDAWSSVGSLPSFFDTGFEKPRQTHIWYEYNLATSLHTSAMFTWTKTRSELESTNLTPTLGYRWADGINHASPILFSAIVMLGTPSCRHLQSWASSLGKDAEHFADDQRWLDLGKVGYILVCYGKVYRVECPFAASPPLSVTCSESLFFRYLVRSTKRQIIGQTWLHTGIMQVPLTALILHPATRSMKRKT